MARDINNIVLEKRDVYHIGGKHYFSLKAACKHKAKMMLVDKYGGEKSNDPDEQRDRYNAVKDEFTIMVDCGMQNGVAMPQFDWDRWNAERDALMRQLMADYKQNSTRDSDNAS